MKQRRSARLNFQYSIFTIQLNNDYPKVEYSQFRKIMNTISIRKLGGGIVTMEVIEAKLADRLTAKWPENNETELFIKDVIWIVTSSPGFDIDATKGRSEPT